VFPSDAELVAEAGDREPVRHAPHFVDDGVEPVARVEEVGSDLDQLS
jgi:hypothetical protein